MLLHRNTEGLLCTSIMVFILINYNMFWNFGLSEYPLSKVFIIYPFILLLSLVVKKIISFPLTEKLHASSLLRLNKSKHVTFPLMIITLNSIICIAISTYLTHTYQSGHYTYYYLLYWSRTIIVSIPLFFFVVKPQVKFYLSNLQK